MRNTCRQPRSRSPPSRSARDGTKYDARKSCSDPYWTGRNAGGKTSTLRRNRTPVLTRRPPINTPHLLARRAQSLAPRQMQRRNGKGRHPPAARRSKPRQTHQARQFHRSRQHLRRNRQHHLSCQNQRCHPHPIWMTMSRIVCEKRTWQLHWPSHWCGPSLSKLTRSATSLLPVRKKAM